MTDMTYERPWTWRDRMRHRLFPSHLPPEIPEGLPAAVLMKGDVIHTNVETRLSWIDRLRVLVSGRILTRVRVGSEQPVNVVWSRSVAHPVWRFDRES